MKRIITMALAIIMLIGCFPIGAMATQTKATQADGKPLGMDPVSGGYKTMTTSQKMLDVLKVMEGFYAEPYWDYAQWTVGYGSYAGSRVQSQKPDIKVTPDEAEVMLKEQLAASYEKSVNDFCRKIGKQPTQNQFDALVSFTYNLGAKWMNGSRLATWLKNPSTEMELVNAMGQWCRAGGEMLFGLVQRRVREAIIFLKGEYYLSSEPNANHGVKSDLRVISNRNLPYYSSVIYQYDYSTAAAAVGKGHAVAYFPIGGTYTDLLVPSRDKYRFAGWKITKINNNTFTSGSMVDASTAVMYGKNLELTAQWVADGSNPSDDPSEDVKIDLPFTDVPENEWYRGSVEFVYSEKLMNGTSDTLFTPNGTMTRGMLVTVLYRLDGSPAVTDEQRHAFDDTADQYYTDAVAWAKANDIVNGVTDTEFRPNDNVTREQAVAIFYRYCVQYCKLEASYSAGLDGFADAASVAEYAKVPMQWSVGVNLITGQSVNGKMYLSPKDNLSRCQSAAILMRCVEDILSQA